MNEKIVCIELYKKIIDSKYWRNLRFISEKDLHHLNEKQTGMEGLICMPYYVTEGVLSMFPDLKWIQVTGAGYDKADIKAVKERKLWMCNTRGVMSESIAEDVFCKMLYFAKRIPEVKKAQEKHKWENFSAHQWLGSVYTDLSNETIGIFGDGSIAAEIAKRAKAFQMKVTAYGRNDKHNEFFDRFVTGENGRKEIAKNCRFVVCALPYQKETYHLLNEEFFRNMRNDAWFINIARGAIVEEKSLLKALKEYWIAGAGLDVFETEPLPETSLLWDMENVFITAHKSGMGYNWKSKLAELLNQNIGNYLNQNTLCNVVIKP